MVPNVTYGGHLEIIECPECSQIQKGFVEYTPFWNSYVHTCVKCGYIIMESEWNRVETEREDFNGE